MSEIGRVLKKDGLVIFSEPNMFNPQTFLMKHIKYIGFLFGEVPGETAFFRWKLSSILLRHGFKNIKIKPFDFLHPFTPIKLIDVVEKRPGSASAESNGFFFRQPGIEE